MQKDESIHNYHLQDLMLSIDLSSVCCLSQIIFPIILGLSHLSHSLPPPQ